MPRSTSLPPTLPPARAAAPHAGPGRASAIVLLGASAFLAGGRPADAQLPLLPVLQSGFVRPGTAVALNYGSTEGGNALAVAGAWTPRWRFTVSGAIGMATADGDGERRTAGGVRLAVPVRTPWTAQPAAAFGIAAFVGAGGISLDEGSVVQVPAGVGVSYRRALGDARAIALFATPFYSFTRVSGAAEGTVLEDDARSQLFRASVGADLLVARQIGLTAGYEFGQTADAGRAGAKGGIFGVGLTYAF